MSDTTETNTVEGHVQRDIEKDIERSSESVLGYEGRDAWMTLAGSWIIQFCTLGYISAFGVYEDYYARTFLVNRTPSEISWIGSFQLFMQYAPGILVGRAFDAGYLRSMIRTGALVQVACMFMLSLVQAGCYYQIFLSQAVGSGLGQALLFLPSLSIIGQHFKARRSIATGIAVTGASFGGIVWPIMLNQLSRHTSFANAVRVTAALAGGLLMLANILVRDAYHKPDTHALLNFKSVKNVVSDAPYMVAVVGACFVCLGLFFPYFYLQLYAIDKGIESTTAFYALAILNAGSVLGRLLPNFYADRIGVYNMLVPALACTSVLLFALLGGDITTVAGLVAFACLYGFFSGSYYSLIPSLICQLTPNMNELGTRMGFAFTCVGVFMLCGSPIDGALLRSETDTYNWTRCIVFCGAAIMVGATFMLISRMLFAHRGSNRSRGQKV